MEEQYQIEGHKPLEYKDNWYTLCEPTDIVDCQEQLLYILSGFTKLCKAQKEYDCYRIVKVRKEVYSVWHLSLE